MATTRGHVNTGSASAVQMHSLPILELSTLLGEASIEASNVEALKDESLQTWLELSRTELLSRLHRIGIKPLAQRQRLANALARAVREGRCTGSHDQTPSTAASARAMAPAAIERLSMALMACSDEASRQAMLHKLGLSEADATLLSAADGQLEAMPWPRLARALAGEYMAARDAALLPDAMRFASVRLGFYAPRLGSLGSELTCAIYDYADFGEQFLGFTAFVFYDANAANSAAAVSRFSTRFGDRLIALPGSLDAAAGAYEEAMNLACVASLYVLKFGHALMPRIGGLSSSIKILVHAVGEARQAHGNVFSRCSPCVPAAARVSVVPFVVRQPCLTPSEGEKGDMRAELGIAPTDIVFGRYGAHAGFDVPVARSALISVAKRRRDVWFLLMRTAHVEGTADLPNVVYLPCAVDDDGLERFIRTCDAMLHGRAEGEAFGQAAGRLANRS